MKTTTQELKQYITRLFQLSNNETWEEEAAENILPERFINDSPLAHLTLETYTYYNNELHDLSIYPFLMYANNQLISVGYLNHFDMDFLYLTDTKNTIIDERHLLREGGTHHE
ncbi:SAUGI family uracil-DNA glycosylase inhibitor [Staphylococcus aureus]|uniref:SAUGI family uracil-DNA glycosylase inhibitor n=1 Tax=Staphylococcus aureus TaxID=1280 RepID=UPI000CD22CA0|nr:SAUGI family uracil-DNA glycosylase inhibitor [Staphylococcus aureus]